MKFEPHDYQKDALDFLDKHPCAALFADPGLGKTAITLHHIERLWWRSGCSMRTLIIAPLRVIYSVWPDEIDKWDLPFSWSILHGKGKEEKPGKADIDLLNAENIFWLLERPELPKYGLLVIDESSLFKSYSAKRFKALRKQLGRFPRRLILTGTPSPKSLEDLFSQIYIVDRGEALGQYITHFRNKYFYQTSYRNFTEYSLKPGADKVIQHRIASLVKRIDAEAYLNLPPLLENTINVELPLGPVRRLYDDLEKRMFAELGENESIALNSAASAYSTCRQIANGRFYRPQGLMEVPQKSREVIPLHRAKREAIRELVGELQGKPVLVAYHYRHDLAQLIDEFGPKTPIIGGGSTAKNSKKIIDKWNRGEIKILLAHPQSMAHGINLQGGGNDVIWFSLTDNLEHYLQFIRRIYRQGIRGQVRVHHIVAKNTIDEAIMKRLKYKDKTQKALLDALKEYRKGAEMRYLQNEAIDDALMIGGFL